MNEEAVRSARQAERVSLRPFGVAHVEAVGRVDLDGNRHVRVPGPGGEDVASWVEVDVAVQPDALVGLVVRAVEPDGDACVADCRFELRSVGGLDAEHALYQPGTCFPLPVEIEEAPGRDGALPVESEDPRVRDAFVLGVGA